MLTILIIKFKLNLMGEYAEYYYLVFITGLVFHILLILVFTQDMGKMID